MTKFKKAVSACLAISMLTAATVSSMAAEEDVSSPKISIVTEINGNGVITESVGGELKTTTYTSEDAATADAKDEAESTDAIKTETEDAFMEITDFDSPMYNTYLFKFIRAYVEYCIKNYNSEPVPASTTSPEPTASPEPEVTPEPTASSEPTAEPTSAPSETPVAK